MIYNIIQAQICSIMLYHNLSLSLHRYLNRWDWPRVLGSGASSATLQMRQPKALPQLRCELCPPVRATCGACDEGPEGPEGPGLAAMSFKAERREKTCKHSRGSCHRSLPPLSSGNLTYRLLIKPGWKIHENPLWMNVSMGKSLYTWRIFPSNVWLPEGNYATLSIDEWFAH